MTNVPVSRSCVYCSISNSESEMRPYGPNRAFVCFPCAMKPEHIDETNRQCEAQLREAGPHVLIGEETGPRPASREHIH